MFCFFFTMQAKRGYQPANPALPCGALSHATRSCGWRRAMEDGAGSSRALGANWLPWLCMHTRWQLSSAGEAVHGPRWPLKSVPGI